MIEEVFARFPWQVIILISGLMTGFSHFVRKSQLHRLGVFQVGFWKDISSLMVGIFLWMVAPVPMSPISLLIVVAGFMAALGNGAYMSALRGDMSGTSAFSTSAGQLFILLGSFVFFGEWKYFHPSSFQGLINLVSVVIFFVGMYLYSGQKVGRWWKMIILGVVTNVILNFVAKYVSGIGISPVESTVALYFGTLAGDIILLIWRKQSFWIGWKDGVLGLMQGVLGGLAVLLYLQALTVGPLSLVSITRRVAIMAFTIFVGMTWFGERKGISWKKIVGLVMALVVFGLVGWVNR